VTTQNAHESQDRTRRNLTQLVPLSESFFIASFRVRKNRESLVRDFSRRVAVLMVYFIDSARASASRPCLSGLPRRVHSVSACVTRQHRGKPHGHLAPTAHRGYFHTSSTEQPCIYVLTVGVVTPREAERDTAEFPSVGLVRCRERCLSSHPSRTERLAPYYSRQDGQYTLAAGNEPSRSSVGVRSGGRGILRLIVAGSR